MIKDDRRAATEEVVGLDVPQTIAETLRLESLLRTSIDPRLPPLAFHCVPVAPPPAKVLVFTGPRIWAFPDAVSYKKHWRFDARNVAGKYPLDVEEMRSHVLLADQAADKLRSFRSNRIGAIKAGDTPVPLLGTARLVLHLVPFLSPAPDFALPAAEIPEHVGKLQPLHHRAAGWAFNVDGMVSFASGSDHGKLAYIQAFRNGALEVVEADLLTYSGEDKVSRLPLVRIEDVLLKSLPNLLDFLDLTGGGYPLAVMLSLLNVQGFAYCQDSRQWMLRRIPVDREDLILPDLLWPERPPKLPQAMRPIFDILWNGAGLAASPSYDDAGSWEPRRKE